MHIEPARELNSIIDPRHHVHHARSSVRRGTAYARPKGADLVPEDGSRKIGITSGLRIAHECLIGRPLLIPRRVKRFAASAALKESGTASRSGVHEKTEAARSDVMLEDVMGSLAYVSHGIPRKAVTIRGFHVDQARTFERYGSARLE